MATKVAVTEEKPSSQAKAPIEDAGAVAPVKPAVETPPVAPVATPSAATVPATDAMISRPVGAVPEAPTLQTVSEPVVATAPLAEEPLIVSEKELSIVADPEHLAEEIETLTGEIQALEAKIDRLTGSVVAESVEKSPEKSPLMETPPVAKISELSEPAEPMKTPSSEPPKEPATFDAKKDLPPPPTELISSGEKLAGAGTTILSDISAKSTKPVTPPKLSVNDEEVTTDAQPGGLAIISEILLIFSLIILLALLVLPLVKASLPATLTEALTAIGWPTAAGSAVLGTIFALLGHSKGSFKILGVVLTLVTLVMFLAVGTDGTLSDILSPIGNFYK